MEIINMDNEEKYLTGPSSPLNEEKMLKLINDPESYSVLDRNILTKLREHPKYHHMYDVFLSHSHQTCSSEYTSGCIQCNALITAVNPWVISEYNIKSENLLKPIKGIFKMEDYKSLERVMYNDEATPASRDIVRFAIAQMALKQDDYHKKNTYIFDPSVFYDKRELSKEEFANYVHTLIKDEKFDNIFNKRFLVIPIIFLTSFQVTVIVDPRCGLEREQKNPATFEDPEAEAEGRTGRRSAKMYSFCRNRCDSMYADPMVKTVLDVFADHFEMGSEFNYKYLDCQTKEFIQWKDSKVDCAFFLLNLMGNLFDALDEEDISEWYHKSICPKKTREINKELVEVRVNLSKSVEDFYNKTVLSEETKYLMGKRRAIIAKENSRKKAMTEEASKNAVVLD